MSFRCRWSREITFADFRVRAGKWVCRWCRSKAERICDIEHQSWCPLIEEERDGETTKRRTS